MATNTELLFVSLTGNASNTDAASYAASSVAPVSGQVCYAAIVTYRAAGVPAIPTASGTNGFGGAWAQVVTETVGSNLRLTVFSSVAQSAVAGVITFDFGAETQLAAVWRVVTSPYVNTTTPTVQTKTETLTDTTTTMTVVLNAALTAAANWVLSFFAQQLGSGPSITSAAWLEYSLQPTSNNTASDGAALQLSAGPGITATMLMSSSAVSKIGIAIEVAQDGTGVSAAGGGRSGSAYGLTR